MIIFIYCYPFFIIPILIRPASFTFLASLLLVFALFLWLLVFSFPHMGIQYSIMASFQCIDDLRFWILYVSLFLIGVSTVIFFKDSKFFSARPLFVLVLTCIIFFSSSRFIDIYILYEFSLIPIVYIILKWGVYSERSKRALYMLLYTMIFTLPIMIILLYILYTHRFLIVYITRVNSSNMPLWVFLILFLGFAVKLPLYGLHYWLPQAHVEAPTVGSMVLAGLLLKLGGYGLIRIFFLIDSFFNRLLVSYIIVSILLVSLVTCYQADFKRLVAYSSVIHMTAILVILLTNRALTYKVYLIIIVFHGVLSPLTFFLVGIIYSLFKRRLLVHIGGIFSNSYTLYAICLVVFLMSVPTPPFPQFYFEVLIFISIVSASKIIWLVLLGFTFLSLLINLMWFTPTCLSANWLSTATEVKVSEILICFIFLFYILILYIIMVAL